jgi:hypothetical protein
MSIFALAILRGPATWPLTTCAPRVRPHKATARSKFLLPKGGHGLQLSCSGWSAVLGIDADGGTPDGDFTKEGGGQVPARRRPCGLFAVLAGVVSNLICQAGNELRPLRQILAPNVMIMKR